MQLSILRVSRLSYRPWSVICFLFFMLTLPVFAQNEKTHRLEREGVRIEVSTDGTFTLEDLNAKLKFEQNAGQTELKANSFAVVGSTITYELHREGDVRPVFVSLEIRPDRQVEIRIEGTGQLNKPLAYPAVWKLNEGDDLLLPVGEGVRWPAIVPKNEEVQYCTLPKSYFASRNLIMGMWGVLRKDSWIVNALEDGANESMSVTCDEQRRLVPTFYCDGEADWNGQRRWAYPRVIRVMFGKTGGLTAAAKCYREYRKPFGYGLTLREKMKLRHLPQMPKMAGAANIWLWHDDYAQLLYGATTEPLDMDNTAAIKEIATEMKSHGMDRVLWGIFFQKDATAVEFLKEKLGYLVTKYDNYQDVMQPALQKHIPKHRVEKENCDFTWRRNKNWPDDIVVNRGAKNKPVLAQAWGLYGIDGKRYNQNKMCERQAAPYMTVEIAEDLRQYKYEARFIDCMGTHLGSCLSDMHPMTRRESRIYRLTDLATVGQQGLLCGTEEGLECLLPSFDYSEGKMSVFPYRVDPPMCWRWKSDYFLDQEKADYLKRYMLNPVYRVPLWELVYHECSVNFWYWGDACNNVPAAMPRRDLFNALYATPPMYSFKTKDWPFLKDKILSSYPRATRTARLVCFEEMTSFTDLTQDRTVQQTVFANGTRVIVNFSAKDYTTSQGQTVKAEDFLVLP
ncbi:MAG: glycoside hydrolase [Planctomycetia bacterium]|nr:glycoside hydrolase [Planctomycetia bacterium]